MVAPPAIVRFIRLWTRRLLPVLWLTLTHAAPAAAGDGAESRYVPHIDDLPLMEGLELLADSLISFETHEGRVVEVYGSGSVGTGQRVPGFYRRTLVPLGWRPGDDGQFVRDNEVLRIDVLSDTRGDSAPSLPDGNGHAVLIRFSLSPLP